jgi:hypothetical protein
MQTSNFSKSGSDPHAVAICRYPLKYWKGRRYAPLAPSGWMIKLPWAEFEQAYGQVLAALDPAQVAQELGEDAVLLCFEGDRSQCHRGLVAAWLEANLGIEVPEVETAKPHPRAVQDELF